MGKITGIYSNAAMTTAIEPYSYDESGNRIKTVNANGTTYYIYDTNGNVLAIYTGATPVLTEVPVYGSDRLGTYFYVSNNYEYEIRDNVGSVRVVITEQGTAVDKPISPPSTITSLTAVSPKVVVQLTVTNIKVLMQKKTRLPVSTTLS